MLCIACAEKYLLKQNNSRRVYGKKITRKMTNMEMKYSTKLQKKSIQKIAKTQTFRNNATAEIA